MTPRASTIPCLFALAIAETASAEPTDPSASPPSLPTADAAATLDADGAITFADGLVRLGDPFNALTFYRLGLHLDPAHPEAASVWFRQALCYELGDRHAAAAGAYLDLAGRDPAWSPHATYRAAMATIEREQWGEARLYLDEVRAEAPDSAWAERAAFMTAIVDLEAGQRDAARDQLRGFAEARPGSPLAPRAAAAAAALSQPVPYRSPALAGAMSAVLPGSGQLYAGHTGDAVMAFLANGTLATWSAVLIGHGLADERGWEVGAGAVIGGMAALSWTSNVIGASRGARRANQHALRRSAEAALREADDPALVRDPEDEPLEAAP